MRNKIAFLYNERKIKPSGEDMSTHVDADLDDHETIAAMKKHFAEIFEPRGFEVLYIEANKDAVNLLHKLRNEIYIAFNYTEGLTGNDREAQFPAILENQGIPYTGSTPKTQAIILDKALTKRILKTYGVRTLPYQVLTTGNERLNEDLEDIMYHGNALFVKPNSQGSSAGVTISSIVYSKEQLRKQVRDIYTKLNGSSSIVEPFLEGREFTVAMLGNPPMILPIIETNYDLLPLGYPRIESAFIKWVAEAEKGSSTSQSLICPAELDGVLEREIKDICYKTWHGLEILDWCRIDIKCDKNNIPYFLEVNSPAGLMPPEIDDTSRFPHAARKSGLTYDSLLLTIVKTSLQRYGLPLDR